MKILLVAAGGAIGSVFRYLCILWISRIAPALAFPWGTLTVNAAGSLIIGFLWAVSEAGSMSTALGVFLFAGVLGGFTTFSSFAAETMNLFRYGHTAAALLYILASNIICVALAFTGFAAGKLVTAG